MFVCNLGAICDNVALSQKMVSEWSGVFELFGLALHKTEEHMGRGEALGTELDGRELSSRVTSKRFWMMRQGLTALERVIGHCTFVGLASRGTLCTFHTCYRYIQSHYLENGNLESGACGVALLPATPGASVFIIVAVLESLRAPKRCPPAGLGIGTQFLIARDSCRSCSNPGKKQVSSNWASFSTQVGTGIGSAGSEIR